MGLLYTLALRCWKLFARLFLAVVILSILIITAFSIPLVSLLLILGDSNNGNAQLQLLGAGVTITLLAICLSAQQYTDHRFHRQNDPRKSMQVLFP
jgi:hypothetical protein